MAGKKLMNLGQKTYLMLAALILGVNSAAGLAADRASVTPAAKFKKQMAKIERADKALRMRLMMEPSELQRTKILMTKPMDRLYGELLTLVKTYPKAPESARADAVLMSGSLVEPVMRAKAISIARERYQNNPEIAKAVLVLGFYDEEMAPGASFFFRQIKAKSNSKVLRACATFALASTAEAQKKEADAESLYKEVIKLYPDMKMPISDNTFAAVAEENLFVMKNLSAGKKAPELAGPTIDGTKIKLSDYRGKVVLLSFFGDW